MTIKCSVQVGTAKAVVDSLNAAAASTFCLDFLAKRSWADWRMPLTEDGLFVDVVPGGITSSELEDRADVVYHVETDIVLRKKIPQEDREGRTGRIRNEALDQLSLLTEQLHEFFLTERLTDFDQAVCSDSTVRVSYARDHLQELSQWTSIVRVTHDVTKTIGTALTCSG